jgi:nucleoside-triphosphatase
MNLFLTGDIQVGKSTIIKKILSLHRDWKVGGIVTVTRFGDIPDALGGVYIQPAPGNERYDEENRVGIRWNDNRAEGFAQPFETAAQQLLGDYSDADIILLDELGFMESKAEKFQAAVMAAINSDVPVLGVIKPRRAPFLDTVRSAPDVETVTVTVENRERMFAVVEKLTAQAVQEHRNAAKNR